MQKYLYLFLVCLIVSTGCDNREGLLLQEDMLDAQMVSANFDDLSRTMEFVFGDSRFDRKEFEEKISSGLNRWVSEVTKDEQPQDDWKLSEEAKQLVAANNNLAVLDRVDEVSFLNSDGYFIQQAAWMKKIGERVLSSEKLAPFELYRLAADDFQEGDAGNGLDEIVAKLNPNCPQENVDKLTDAIQLFDWVSRNIQLLPTIEIEAEELTGNLLITDVKKSPEEIMEFYSAPANRPAGGIRGLGYTHYPYQTLVYGRGDFVEKAKLFMALCHQSEIDAVMLAVKDSDGNEIPWLPAVLLGDQLYLFDSQLGLPLPGEQLGSIATLAEVRENGDLITALNLSLEESTRDETDYRITAEQVKEVTALVYATPTGVSRRMKFLNDRLIGDQRMRLTTDESDTLEKAGQLENVSAKLWDIGFKTQQFRAAVNTAIQEAEFDTALQKKLQWYYSDEQYIDSYVRYRTARNLYFIGKFETERNTTEKSAIELFNRLMYSDETIASLDTNEQIQYLLNIRQEGQTSAEFQNRLQGMKNRLRLIRRDAGLFLAQSCFDFGNVGTCANWVKRVKETGYSERWNTGLEYLTARAFEATKEYDRAIEIYEKGEHDQFHGNLVRARMLKAAREKIAE